MYSTPPNVQSINVLKSEWGIFNLGIFTEVLMKYQGDLLCFFLNTQFVFLVYQHCFVALKLSCLLRMSVICLVFPANFAIVIFARFCFSNNQLENVEFSWWQLGVKSQFIRTIQKYETNESVRYNCLAFVQNLWMYEGHMTMAVDDN